MTAKGRLRTSLRALQHRNYRLFFLGQGISLIGTWMTRLASSWLVYRLSSDPFLLGLVNFASLVPSFVLGAVAGVWVDRSRNLRRLIWWTQFAGMIQSFGLAATSLAHSRFGLSAHATIVTLIALNLLQGIINSFDMPGRQAFLPRMVTNKEDLANGIALNSSLFNGARLIGPALAGALIAVVGETWCFLSDALSYIAVLWALSAMVGVDQPGVAKAGQRLVHGLKEGFAYAWRFEPIRAVLQHVAVLSFLGMPYTVLLPVFAKEILGGGPSTLGLLTAASGFGALIGALRLAGRESMAGIGRVITWGGAVFAVALASFALSRLLPLSLPLLLATGFGMLTQSASCQTILQTVVQPDKRGRVMSLYLVAWGGMAPFGSLLSGYLAKVIGAPATLVLCAAGCGVSTAFFAWRLPAVRAAMRHSREAAAAPPPAAAVSEDAGK